jgi:large subunit ribosomal protein L24
MRILKHRKTDRANAKNSRRHAIKVERMRMPVTRGDTVRVMRGEDKGKEGKILRVFPKTGRVTIEGVNIVKRHRRATQTTESGIVEFPAPIHHSKAMLIDPKSGEPTRIRRRKDADGTVERIAVKSDQSIPRNR